MSNEISIELKQSPKTITINELFENKKMAKFVLAYLEYPDNPDIPCCNGTGITVEDPDINSSPIIRCDCGSEGLKHWFEFVEKIGEE